MLTRLLLQNFTKFSQAEMELGKAVVLIGSNNSGKTSVLQAPASSTGDVAPVEERLQIGIGCWTGRGRRFA